MMVQMSRGRLTLLAAVAAVLGNSCTGASVYAVNGAGPEGPDRTLLQGTICAPIPTGVNFPIKIVFAVEGGNPPVQAQDTAAIETALADVASQTPPGTEFALISFHTVAQSFTVDANGNPQNFVSSAEFDADLKSLQGASAQQSGPVSLEAPLTLADAIISGDMQTGCVATLRRTHYYVMLLLDSEDVTCTNTIFASALQSICEGAATTGNAAGLTDCTCFVAPQGGGGGIPASCEACILGGAAAQLKALGSQYGGVVSLVPVYFREFNAGSDGGAVVDDPVIDEQVGFMTAAAGTAPLVTDTGDLDKDLTGYNYSALLATPILRRFFAWNRNVVARDGQELVDSDQDGLPDVDETNVFMTDPTAYSSAQDGISDGVKVRMGMPPNTPVVLQDCSPSQDTDFDRLNDCEEELVGTDPCASDTDGDGLSDLVEVGVGTNPLVPEGDQDSDGDGITNANEVISHSDPRSVDLAYRATRAYATDYTLGTPTPDGRPCYDFQVSNISLMATQAIPDEFFPTAAGTNFIYVYGEWAYGQGGAEISQLWIQQVLYDPPALPTPAAPILITPDLFQEGT